MSDNGRTFEGLFDNDAMVGKLGQVSTIYHICVYKYVYNLCCALCNVHS